MSVIIDISDALVAEINNGTFSQPVTAIREYVPCYDLSEMHDLHVTVVPQEVRLAGGDRSRGQGDFSIDVAVQQKLQQGDNAEIDQLTGFTEELMDYLRAKRLTQYPNAAWLHTDQRVLYAPEHVIELRQFTSVFTLTYRVLR